MWERRTDDRVHLRIWVEERVGETVYYQRTANISRSGLFIEGTIPHQPGTSVRLAFSLPGEDQVIEVEGVVVASAEGQRGMGIRIVDMRDEDDFLDRFQELLLLEMTHMPLAVFAIWSGWTRWLELRLEDGPGRVIAGWLWPVFFSLTALTLLLYREI